MKVHLIGRTMKLPTVAFGFQSHLVLPPCSGTQMSHPLTCTSRQNFPEISQFTKYQGALNALGSGFSVGTGNLALAGGSFSRLTGGRHE